MDVIKGSFATTRSSSSLTFGCARLARAHPKRFPDPIGKHDVRKHSRCFKTVGSLRPTLGGLTCGSGHSRVDAVKQLSSSFSQIQPHQGPPGGKPTSTNCMWLHPMYSAHLHTIAVEMAQKVHRPTTTVHYHGPWLAVLFKPIAATSGSVLTPIFTPGLIHSICTFSFMA